MSIKDRLTKEALLRDLADLAEEARDPTSDFGEMMAEQTEIVASIREFDPILADKVEAAMVALRDLADYASTNTPKS